MSEERTDFDFYLVVKTIIYMVAGFLALFIATCSGGCTIEAIATGEHKNLSYIAWAVAFGITAYVCLSGFGQSRKILERALQGLPLEDPKEEKDEETKSAGSGGKDDS